ENRTPESTKSTPGVSTEFVAQQWTRFTGETGQMLFNYNADQNPDKFENYFHTSEELHEKLKTLKEQGRLPAMICVNANHELIAGSERRGFSPHAISIVGYDPITRRVDYSNQWK